MVRKKLYRECDRNENGGFYTRGERYNFAKKCEIVTTYFELWAASFPTRPTFTDVARHCKVSRSVATKFVKEFEILGYIIDPKEEAKTRRERNAAVDDFLTVEEEVFLLALRSEDASRPNASYQDELEKQFGKKVSSKFISTWFKNRYDFAGTFRKRSMIPKDKFKTVNLFRYLEFRMFLNVVNNHQAFNFLDEKHIVNYNGIELKGRTDPLTGIVEGVEVDGDFRDSKTIMACVSVNPNKQQHVAYTIGSGNNTAISYVHFIEMLVVSKFLTHGEVLVLDNAAIHHQAEAATVEDFLWNHEVDGSPLRVLCLFLPTRSPELNPIELVFHILVRRMKSFHYRTTAPLDEKINGRIKRIFDELTLETIASCAKHCGYNV